MDFLLNIYNRNIYSRAALSAGALLMLSACSGGGSATTGSDVAMADTLTHHAQYLVLADQGHGVVRADIANPWSEGKTLARYALVQRDSLLPENLDSDIKVVRVPVEKAAVFSSVYTSALNELGALDCVKAVADGAYFPPADTVRTLMAQGLITDAGAAAAPSVELLAQAGVEAVLLSVFNGATVTLPPTAVEVKCVDYMETTPIGRAEWLLLLGELTDKRREAQKIFSDVIDNYSSTAFKAAGAQSPKPKILAETEVSGVWYVAGGNSYMARIFADAGAEWPWADTDDSGSLALSIEDVAAKAMDADLWLVRGYGFDTTPESLAAINSRYKAFKAWKEGNIYSCNSAERPIFDDAAFHPDRILAEYTAIFHPEVMPGYELRYFKRTGK